MTPLFDHADAMKHPILSKWLSGTTCHNYWIGRSVLFENAEYIVLKHNSHTSYTGRFSGNQCCQSYAKLYLKEDLLKKSDRGSQCLASGHGELLSWAGRISKQKIILDCRLKGIEFDINTPKEGCDVPKAKEH